MLSCLVIIYIYNEFRVESYKAQPAMWRHHNKRIACSKHMNVDDIGSTWSYNKGEKYIKCGAKRTWQHTSKHMDNMTKIWT